MIDQLNAVGHYWHEYCVIDLITKVNVRGVDNLTLQGIAMSVKTGCPHLKIQADTKITVRATLPTLGSVMTRATLKDVVI
jgi:hypothetical protein